MAEAILTVFTNKMDARTNVAKLEATKNQIKSIPGLVRGGENSATSQIEKRGSIELLREITRTAKDERNKMAGFSDAFEAQIMPIMNEIHSSSASKATLKAQLEHQIEEEDRAKRQRREPAPFNSPAGLADVHILAKTYEKAYKTPEIIQSWATFKPILSRWMLIWKDFTKEEWSNYKTFKTILEQKLGTSASRGFRVHVLLPLLPLRFWLTPAFAASAASAGVLANTPAAPS
ncbi:hypothetical protein V8F33_012124 [Rhypophila sp. PSN 637]